MGPWWDRVKGGLGHVRRLVVSLDNGPNGSGSQTPFRSRMVASADASGLVVRLVYYPPYRSTYHPVERCWSAPERTWRGGLLTSLEAILGSARRMTWQGETPAVHTLSGEYPGGVTLDEGRDAAGRGPGGEAKTRPKYDIAIRPMRPSDR